MKQLGRIRFVAIVLALFCAATLSADTLTLTSAPTGIIGPYIATINGTPGIEVICVSYFNTTYLNTLYNYNPASFSSFTTSSMPQPTSLGTWYQIAWLSNQLFDIAPGTTQQALQWAIWKLADPVAAPDVPVPSGLVTAVNTLISQAQAQSYTTGQFNNFTVFTPTNYVVGVSGPQQFIVRTPEASAIFMLLLTASGIAVFTWRQRRRVVA